MKHFCQTLAAVDQFVELESISRIHPKQIVNVNRVKMIVAAAAASKCCAHTRTAHTLYETGNPFIAKCYHQIGMTLLGLKCVVMTESVEKMMIGSF